MINKISFYFTLIASAAAHFGVIGAAGYYLKSDVNQYHPEKGPSVNNVLVHVRISGQYAPQKTLRKEENPKDSKKVLPPDKPGQALIFFSDISKYFIKQFESSLKAQKPACPSVDSKSETIAGSSAVFSSGASDEYLKAVRQKIEQAKYYPDIAKRMRFTGNVTVAFKITSHGIAENLYLSKPACIQLLNETALNIIRKSSPFPKPENPAIEGRIVEVEIVFK